MLRSSFSVSRGHERERVVDHSLAHARGYIPTRVTKVRFSFILVIVTFTAASATFAATARPPAVSTSRPNILFVMADDHAAHAIGAYGSTLLATPNIDRIAREGMLLTNCFATNAVCTPSRAAILTGKYSHKNGVPTFNTFDATQWHVARELQR